ncbi:two-component system, LuxR family, sensor kinase FixL [Burkholderiaceae bacterium]|nr:two-component system, LuxR family, sensor kinase FixL [Burkholderiaceae bacterium]
MQRTSSSRQRRRTAAPAREDATLALDAFDRGSALVDLTRRVLRWCSPGFAAHCCVAAGAELEQLETVLPGVLAALSRVGCREPDAHPQQWRTPSGDEVQAALVAPVVAALRLRDASADTLDRERAARRHLEDRERMLFTSRAISVGEMASTLAHELNQPIGTVANVLRGVRTRLTRANAATAADAAALLPGLQLALDQALFASRIIARMREYTHSRQPRRDRLDLGCVLRESLALLDWELQRDGVAVDLAIADAPCPVHGDEVMLQQLFVNLLRNAIEAMRDNAALPRRLAVRLALQRGGREVLVSLRDNGCGLPQDAQARLFVPFQSTKPNGMGMGLNICRSFVELHQGRLWFGANDDADGSEAARGCCFHVALPIAGEPRPASLPQAGAGATADHAIDQAS